MANNDDVAVMIGAGKVGYVLWKVGIKCSDNCRYQY
jgi:hypothetical protein